MSAPIPAHVVTGPLGSGKTTAIARLLAGKPPEQDWVVLLNEFSDAGIDALTVASAARGAFDVRLVPGGCLCCAGEQDFRRNLQELVTTRRPHRIVIEPSGLGHPAGIVEELLAYESSGALRLAGVVALVDPRRLRDGSLVPGTDAYAQAEIADALALSKPDLADASDLERFEAFVAGLYPAKSWHGPLVDGRIPAGAFEPRGGLVRVARPGERPAAHVAERHAHPHASPAHAVADAAGAAAQPGGPPEFAAANGSRREVRHLGQRALRWVFPRAVAFSRPRLASLLAAAGSGEAPLGAGVRRLKGVFRTSEDEWVLAQAESGGVDMRAASWRRDSRVELLVDADARQDVLDWDAAWVHAQQPR